MKKLFPLLFLLISCGSAAIGGNKDPLFIPSPGIEQPTKTLTNVPSDSGIYTGPYTCANYRVAPDERLIKYNYIDNESYNNYLEALTTAMSAWDQALGFEIFTQVADDVCTKTDINARVDVDWFDPTKSGVKNPAATGAYTIYPKPQGTTCSCYIDINPNAAGNWRVLAHELGHCLGLGHNNEDSNSLMAPYYDLTGEISQQMVDLIKEKMDETLVGPEFVVKPLWEQCGISN